MTGRAAVPAEESPPDRAQAEVLGVVLLLGLVAVGSLSLMVVATSAVSDTQSQAETERIEQSFVQLSQTMATATTAGDMPKAVSFDAGESGAITKTDAGTFTIQGGNVNVTRTVGAIEYRHDDGSVVAYQAGGVFAERGNQTRVISNPPISYDPVDETLTLPITDMSESQDLSSGPVRVSTAATDPLREASLVENDTVTLTIQGPYYRGWEEYFRDAAGSGVVDSIDHSKNTVVVKFGYFELDEALDTGATVGGKESKYFHDKHGNIGEYYRQGVLMPEMDPVIDQIIKDSKSDPVADSDNLRMTNGTYYVDEIDGAVDYDVDLTKDDVTLVVGGDVNLDGGDIHVTDRDGKKENVFRIYAGGDKFTLDGEVCVQTGSECEEDATAIQFYGPSTMAVDLGPGSAGTFEGLLYVASNSEQNDWWNNPEGKCGAHHQIHEQANGADFTGSMVAYSVCAQSNGNEFDYDTDLADIDLDAYPDEYSLPPQLTYLNVAVYQMDVDNS
ncbi:hypothetical protein Halru_1929 [Halovivax ruber XH-70]|uniref:DUF7305 domain-containing protein n=1 Tax=Halovivax ruber (strain DSM 18193 / JCM 13892 / XH-70) TaxID=797302 RepID=L0IEX7_HALRX|nr:hypothetical protein [Halovivax ruber]AGB16527.1 hypothetical protein Halru_1929 [Halovivax ruber XH-70]